MKKLLFPIILFFSVTVFGQPYITSPNVIYLLPPTNGCNGVAIAIDTCPSFPGEFTVLPAEIPCSCPNSPIDTNSCPCAWPNHRSGDTLFLDLYSIPCEFWEVCGSFSGYLYCVVKVDYITDIKEIDQNNFKVSNFGNSISIDNPNLDIDFIEVIDLYGRIISRTKAFSDSQINIDINSISKGLYFVNIFQKNKRNVLIKILKN